MSEPTNIEILDLDGLPVAAATQEAASNLIIRSVLSRQATAFRFINAYSISLALSDERYRDELRSSGVNFPDGKPLSILVRRRADAAGHPASQVRGPSMFAEVLERGQRIGLRHYFLGSTTQTLEMLQLAIAKRYPDAVQVGHFSPPFRELALSERAEMYKSIRESEPDVVWVGLGTPKQDFEVVRLARELGIPCLAVGAAFDFVAGTQPEAPSWMSSLGIEWIFRLATEPRRLWRRYLFGNLAFLRFARRTW